MGRLTRFQLLLLLLFGGLHGACADAAPLAGKAGARPHELQQPIIVGEDDRQELYQLEPAADRDTIQQSVVALMYAHRLKFEPDGSVTLRASTLGETLELCEDEPFREQPAAAYCTGSLVDDDLVLTAGHCMGSSAELALEQCQKSFIVFEYRTAPDGSTAPISGQNVFACREVVYHRRTSGTDDFLDLALLRLDRPVPDRTPVRLAEIPPAVGDDLLLASHGAALPLKVQLGATVLETPEGTNYFVAATDSFAGGSGAPLFNASLELVGHQVRGELDWEISGGCRRSAQTDTSKEQHQLLSASLRELCAENIASSRLCGQVPACGDGLCSADEDPSTCPDDCQPRRCGDAVCEFEERTSCPEDCAAFDHVPDFWTSDPADYQAPPEPSASGMGEDSGCALANKPRESGRTPLGPLLLSIIVGIAIVSMRRRNQQGPLFRRR